MFTRALVALFLLYNVTNIEGVPEFRPDYSYSELAGGWMKFHLIPATWSDARIMCHAEGAVLASPLTQELHNAMVEHTSQKSSVRVIFTGVHSTYSKGVYASIEGEPLSKLPITWASGEPNNYKNSESCLAMLISANGTMADVKCNDVFPYVCFKKSSPTLTVRRTKCGTFDTEYSFDSRTGKCYKFHRRGLNWPNAYLTCMAEGGHLAVINSEEEFTALKELFGKHPDNVIFSEHTTFAALGFSDPNDGGSWITIHGETLKEAGFEKWQSGEPNNASQPVGELCGVMYRGNGNFYDAPCYWSLAFICEKKPESLEEEDISL